MYYCANNLRISGCSWKLLSPELSLHVVTLMSSKKTKTNKKIGKEKQPRQEVDRVKGISPGGVAVSLLNPKIMLKFSLKL